MALAGALLSRSGSFAFFAHYVSLSSARNLNPEYTLLAWWSLCLVEPLILEMDTADATMAAHY